MKKIEALNTEHHKDYRVIRDYRSGLTYDQGAAMVFPCEIQQVQREYPILFRKHSETGRFLPNALLGFDQHENLFLHEQQGWLGRYIPLSFTKGPFFIGFEEHADGGLRQFLSLDTEDPRISLSDGEAIFNEDGGLSTFMLDLNHRLALMHENYPLIQTMVDAFTQVDLIEPLTVKIELNNGEEINFGGAYTIAEEKLRALDNSALGKLNKAGYLSAAYYIAGSVDNLKHLIDIKNKRI